MPPPVSLFGGKLSTETTWRGGIKMHTGKLSGIRDKILERLLKEKLLKDPDHYLTVLQKDNRRNLGYSSGPIRRDLLMRGSNQIPSSVGVRPKYKLSWMIMTLLI